MILECIKHHHYFTSKTTQVAILYTRLPYHQDKMKFNQLNEIAAAETSNTAPNSLNSNPKQEKDKT